MNVCQVGFNANNLSNSNFRHNSYQNSEHVKDFNSNEQENKFNKKKGIYSVLALAVFTGSIYIAGKEGYLGSTIKNKLAKGTNSVTHTNPYSSVNTPSQRVSQSVNGVRDSLPYEIQPPKISDLTPSKEALERSKYIPLEAEYDKIRLDIERNPESKKRFDEIIRQLKDTSSELNDRFKSISQECMDFEGGVIERAIYQKRYFSIPGNQREHYCCQDPLLYKAAREEALDIQIGYHLLAPFQNAQYDIVNNTKSNTSLLDGLRAQYDITPDNNQFINECIANLNFDGALCCGAQSRLHAYELARVGKIFREALGVSVK